MRLARRLRAALGQKSLVRYAMLNTSVKIVNFVGKGTKSVRGGVRHVNDGIGSVIEPIYQTSLFDYREPEQRPSLHGVVPLKYSREDNPTVHAVESKMAELEHGVDALGTSSGMAAITTLMMSLLSRDSTVLMPLDVYGSTLVLMERLGRFGVKTVITDPGTENVINSLRGGVNVVFIESVSNPLLRFMTFLR